MSAIYILWLRELKRYSRSRAQVVASLGQPLLYLLVLGFGLGPVFQKAGQGSYVQFVAPGVIGMTSLLQNAGAFFGIYAFTHLTQRVGRRPAFAIAFVAAMLSTAFTFWNLNDFTDIFWMIPLMGFCQLSLFGGYAIYLPELFPTRLRSTGTSFCYNVGRFVAAVGPLALGLLTSRVFAGYPEPMRYAGVTMCLVFLIGLATVPFAPETKGRPLPE